MSIIAFCEQKQSGFLATVLSDSFIDKSSRSLKRSSILKSIMISPEYQGGVWTVMDTKMFTNKL